MAEQNVNADKAKEIGEIVVSDMTGNMPEYSFKRKNQAITLGSKQNIKVGGEEIDVHPQLLFQRIITISESSCDDLEELFQYELCAYPSSLFDATGFMREANKPQLATAIWNMGDCAVSEIPTGCTFVLDGGSMIQRIPWSNGSTFETICGQYCRFLQSYYGNAHVVFDGYMSGPATKDSVYNRSSKAKVGTNFYFNPCTACKTKKETFLTNAENKQNFIYLGEYLTSTGCTVHRAIEDAKVLITHTAVNLSKEMPTVVIGEDIDLLVLLYSSANDDFQNIYFKSDISSKANKIWDISKIRSILGIDKCRRLPFVHAFSGCDTVSRLYRTGKSQLLKKTMSDPNIQQKADLFLADSTHEHMKEARESIVSIFIV